MQRFVTGETSPRLDLVDELAEYLELTLVMEVTFSELSEDLWISWQKHGGWQEVQEKVEQLERATGDNHRECEGEALFALQLQHDAELYASLSAKDYVRILDDDYIHDEIKEAAADAPKKNRKFFD